MSEEAKTSDPKPTAKPAPKPAAKTKAKAKVASKPTPKTTRKYKTRELKPETLSVYVKNYVEITVGLDESSTIDELLDRLGQSIIESAESRIRG